MMAPLSTKTAIPQRCSSMRNLLPATRGLSAAHASCPDLKRVNSRCKPLRAISFTSSAVDASSYFARSNYASLPGDNKSRLARSGSSTSLPASSSTASVAPASTTDMAPRVVTKRVASIKKRVPLPDLVIADAATRIFVQTEVAMSLRSDQVALAPPGPTRSGASRIRLPCGGTILLPPGNISSCSPLTFATARTSPAAFRRVSSVSSATVKSVPRAVSPAAEPFRHATVKVKSTTRRVSIAAVLVAGASSVVSGASLVANAME